MKKLYLALFCFIASSVFLYSQINPSASPYSGNGTHSITQDSATVSNKKVVMYKPLLPPVLNKYPVFIFQPGANGIFGGTINVHTYDIYLKHLASYGFVVLVIDETSAAGMPSGTTFKSVHTWFKQKTRDNTHWLRTYADTNKVVIGGHSNGGVNASGLLIERPDEIQGIVYLASYPSNNFLLPMDMSNYSGKVLDMAGSEDNSSTPATCAEGYDKFTSSACKTWVLINGMGHGGFGDYTNSSQPVGSIGRTNATSTVRHYLVSFMMGQFKNDNTAKNNLFVASKRPNTTGEFDTNCETTTGISETIISNNIEIYPNPSNGNFIVSSLASDVCNTIEIYNTEGRLVLSKNTNNNECNINMNGYAQGLYLVKISTGESVSHTKIIIK